MSGVNKLHKKPYPEAALFALCKYLVLVFCLKTAFNCDHITRLQTSFQRVFTLHMAALLPDFLLLCVAKFLVFVGSFRRRMFETGN